MRWEDIQDDVAYSLRPGVILSEAPRGEGSGLGLGHALHLSGAHSNCGPDPSAAPQDDKRREAFTLIELLVVIFVIVLLMALLLPALSRARRQARAVVCQTHLHQWGLRVATFAGEDDASPRIWNKDRYGNVHEAWSFGGDVPAPGSRSRDFRFCPMASTLVMSPDEDSPDEIIAGRGGTFRAWGLIFLQGDSASCGSYGRNSALMDTRIGMTMIPGPMGRGTPYIRAPSRIPVMLDSIWVWTWAGAFEADPPPESDAIPTANSERVWKSCINRHDGGVNCMFFDGSVRKVGLKELWTLKWHPEYDTAGPWTLAGGVQPSDWPEWMRKFKDY